MTELSRDACAIIDAARGGDDPVGDDRSRVRAALFASLAVGTVVGGAGVAGASAASGTAAALGTGAAVGTGAAAGTGAATGAALTGAGVASTAPPAMAAAAAVASGAVASGAVASGAVASGAVASGAVASGAVASGAVASGAVASGAVASGSAVAGGLALGGVGKILVALVVVGAVGGGTAVVVQRNSGDRAVVAGTLGTRDGNGNRDRDGATASAAAALADDTARPATRRGVVHEDPTGIGAGIAPPTSADRPAAGLAAARGSQTPPADPAVTAAGPVVRPRRPAAARQGMGARSADPVQPTPAAFDEVPALQLGAEAALLQGAERARLDGRPDRALAMIEQHARDHRDGSLAPERDALRVLALCDLGRHSEATSLARIFLADHAASPLAARVRSSCAGL